MQDARKVETSRNPFAFYNSCPWMGLTMHLLEPSHGHVRVDLRGGQAGVSEQLLHGAQVRPIVQHVGGKGMTELVRRKILGKTGHPQILLEQ